MSLIRHLAVAALFVLAFGSIAEAHLVKRALQPAPESPSDQKPAPAPMPAPAPAVVVHAPSCAPVCMPCPPKMNVVLQVKDPCTCCLVEVPVCIPACCTGNPSVCCHRGFLGRQIVTYSWSCGISVDIIFKRNGCYVVRYCGC